MNILITGGSGFLGRALSDALHREEHARITWLTRTPQQNAPAHVRLLGYDALPRCAEQFDVLINLAGAGIAERRWTVTRKVALYASRLTPTQSLLDWIATAPAKPRLLISGSATGWYGAQGDDALTEADTRFTDDFPHQLCDRWEQLARQAEAHGVPVAIVRTGIVLDPAGGILARLRLPFRLGLGGRLGSGRQYMSWISRHDWVRAVRHILHQPDTAHRPLYNLTAPHPVRNAAFTRTLADALHRPARLPAPAFALRLALGELATLLLDGQNVLPAALNETGFRFEHPQLADALAAR